MSSCGLFAWGENTGRAPAGTVFQPMFFSGKSSRTTSPLSQSYLPPPCPEGYSGRHPNCVQNATKEKFSGFNWGNVFGGGGGGGNGDGENLADDNIGQMPDEVNRGSGGGGKISTEQIMSGIESATELAKLFGTKRELSEVEGFCGKQPKGILRSKAVKQAWAKCASDYAQSKIDANKPQRQKQLSTGTWIVIGVSSVVLVGGIMFAIKMKPKQVVMMQTAPVKVK
jgi:hypothetical protein